MLGVRKAGNLQETTELAHLLKKTQTFTCAIAVCPVKPHESWEAYNPKPFPSITYPLASTSFDSTEIKTLHIALLPRLLPCLGVASSFPRDVIFGPTYFGGKGVKDIEAEQGGQKILMMIKHVRVDTKVDTTFLIVIRWAQTQAGTKNTILNDLTDIP
jgi:hypothetical protein